MKILKRLGWLADLNFLKALPAERASAYLIYMLSQPDKDRPFRNEALDPMLRCSNPAG